MVKIRGVWGASDQDVDLLRCGSEHSIQQSRLTILFVRFHHTEEGIVRDMDSTFSLHSILPPLLLLA